MFVPDNNPDEVTIPFFEEASGADGVIGYSTNRSVIPDIDAEISP